MTLFLAAVTIQSGLAQDADVLERTYLSMHPGLYRYQTPAQIRANFDQLRKDWARSRDLKSAYVALSQFTAKIQCGHTYPNFYNQDPATVQAVFAGKNRIPFYFQWRGGKMVVLRDLTSQKLLPVGTEVEQINGIPTLKILSRLMTVARADGGNDYKRRSYLSVFGNDKFEAFDIYFPLFFAIPEGGFKVKAKDLDGAVRTVDVPALSMEDRTGKTSPTTDPVLWNLTLKGQTAVLTMSTWNLFNTQWDWKKFLHDSFATLQRKQTKNLVIDLRGNEGGLSIANDLFAFLSPPTNQAEAYRRYSRYASPDPSLMPYLSSYANQDLSKVVGKPVYVPEGRNMYYPLNPEPKDTPLEVPSAERFNGKLAVLVDSTNSSATFEFESLVQEFKRGKLIGEPTGGNRRGINGSKFYFLRLPNSGLEVDLPLVAQFPTSPQPNRGLIPDIAIYPTRKDLATGRDAVLEKALEQLSE